MKKISTVKAPQAIGPYSQAVFSGDLMFCSGQIPIDPATGEVLRSDIKSEAKRVFENIEALLSEAGLNFSNVVKTTVLLKDINDFAAVNEVYAKCFSEPYPARICFAVSALPKNVNIEVEVIAERR